MITTNKGKQLFIFISIVLFCGCVGPKQPPLNIKEQDFLLKVQNKFHGKTTRNIDPYILTNENPGSRGSYGVNTQLSCENLFKLGEDSANIMKESFNIAKTLFVEILNTNTKYNKIVITFTCDTTSSKYKTLGFSFNTDTLLISN